MGIGLSTVYRYTFSMDQVLKEKFIKVVASQAIFRGWSNDSVKEACTDLDLDPRILESSFPRGVLDVAIAFHRIGDRDMINSLESENLSNLKMREKITFAIKCRLGVIGADKELIRLCMSFFALPHNFLDGSKLIWGTADKIWNFLGDESEDYNFYTKRAILSGVYSSVILFWLGDDSEGNTATWGFLDRRIQNVMQFENLKARIKKKSSNFESLKGPSRLISRIKKPSDKNLLNLPGIIKNSD